MQHVPTSCFDYSQFSPADRLPAFRKLTASLYQTWALGEPESFQAKAFGHQVGELIFTEVEFGATRFRRGARHLQGDGKDFLTLHAQLAGTECLTMEHGIVRLLPGRIYLRDWAYPFDCKSTPMHMYTIVVPRHRLASSDLLDRKNPILEWQVSEPEGGLLFKLWTELVKSFSTVTLKKAELMCEGVLGFVDGLLGGFAREDTPATLRSMERFLAARLRSEVGAEDLCRHFHTSRATVYRLFEPHGGVKAYLSRMRLERTYADLCQADPKHARISEIAASWQFNEPSTFSRKFRQQFERSPSEVIGSDLLNEEIRSEGLIQGAESFAAYMNWFNKASNLNS
jgi:AraC-like DNA-binding protein